MNLPAELTAGASLRGKEHAWAPDAFPGVLARAKELGLACLGGQFQFRAPNATCEMFWLNVDAVDRQTQEPWSTYVARAASEVSTAFHALIETTDFEAEAKRWTNVPSLTNPKLATEQYLCFVAYFISERPAPGSDSD